MQAALRAASARPLTVTVVAFVAGLAGLVATPGADSLWLVAFGRYVAHGHITASSVPYATAPGHAWANVPVLAELAFAGLDHLGGVAALVLAQAVAVALSLALLAFSMRREGGPDASVAAVLVLLVAGSVPALVAVRGQLFSLVLFPAMLALLVAESRTPSRRVWLLVPLVAAWSMLHGAVLLGVAVAGTWVVFCRLRRTPLEAAALIPAMLLAVCATPALERTPRYYADVLGGEAVHRRYGLWAPLTWSVWDFLLVGAAVVLGVLAVRARPDLWLVIAAAGLAVATVRAPRNGVWLLMLLALPAGRAVPLRAPRLGRALPVAAVALACAVAGIGASHASSRANDDRVVIARAVAASATRPVLAEPVLAERLAAAGGRVWMANPVEAFSERAQAQWLDWLEEPARVPPPLRRREPLALVTTDGALGEALARSHSYRLIVERGGSALYSWRPS